MTVTKHLSRITDDILIIRGDKVMVTWQWLSYSRYFREDEYAPLSMEPASYSDYTDSGMFAFFCFCFFSTPTLHSHSL